MNRLEVLSGVLYVFALGTLLTLLLALVLLALLGEFA